MPIIFFRESGMKINLVSTILLGSTNSDHYSMTDGIVRETGTPLSLEIAGELAESDPIWAIRGKAIQAYALLEQALARFLADIGDMKNETATTIFYKIINTGSRNSILEKLLHKKHEAKYNLFWNSYRGRVIFFVPFFGAFLAFMISKSDTLIDSSWFLKLLCVATFLAGIGYAAFLSETVWLLDSLRLIVVTHSEVTDLPALPEKERTAISETVKVAIRRIGMEYKLFRWMMWLLYVTSFTAIWNLFFARGLADLLNLVARKLLS